MAKKKANKKQKSFEENLWDSANKLRGSVEPSEYKHPVRITNEGGISFMN